MHSCFCFTYSFWNFDALLLPQQHPACDLYDVIYLKGLFDLISWTVPSGFHLIFICHSCVAPLTTKELPEGYVERVKHVHDSSGYSPRGYGIFVIYLSSNLFLISLHQLFQEAFKCTFLFIYFLSALVGMNMIGAKRKQRKTFCDITKQLCQPGCCTSSRRCTTGYMFVVLSFFPFYFLFFIFISKLFSSDIGREREELFLLFMFWIYFLIYTALCCICFKEN